ncbi:MAG: hypothetical protein KTR27_15185 [Leptolyngbyaceae cyanobacterium MAG.088]|nr:hypothetical protein [Leptolyngbyaceae cyanobacterium MAG.088]
MAIAEDIGASGGGLHHKFLWALPTLPGFVSGGCDRTLLWLVMNPTLAEVESGLLYLAHNDKNGG